MSSSGVICSSACCSDKPNKTLLITCRGICGRIFHCKCAAFQAVIGDHLNRANNGLQWFCDKCRSKSMAVYASKLTQLSSSLTSLLSVLSQLQLKLTSVSDDVLAFSGSSGVSCSTGADLQLLSKTRSFSEGGSSPAMTLRSASKNASNNRKADNLAVCSVAGPSGMLTTPLTTPQSAQPPSVNDNASSGGKADNLAVCSDAGPSGTLTTPQNAQPPSVNDLHLPLLRVVEPPKCIFISRLSSSTSSDDIYAYILARTDLSSERVKCLKLNENRKNAFVSSFKIFVPSDYFGKLCGSDFWPSGIIVREFITRKENSFLYRPTKKILQKA